MCHVLPDPFVIAHQLEVVGSGSVQTSLASGWTEGSRASGDPVKPAFGRVGRILAELFPEGPAPVPLSTARRWLIAGAYVVCLFAGAALSLARYVGEPPWKTIYAEDLPIYLVGALAHPWGSMFDAYAGYLQLSSRIIGQIVSLLPLHDAAAAFAVSGALVTAGCALFIFRVSAGHVRHPLMRGLLALSVILLPVALLQIADSGVNTPWYLLMALFWAMLWRPRSAGGMTMAALVGFLAATSNITAAVFAVLVVARLIALPRVREHAVTAGWLAGCLVQLPYFLHSETSRISKLATPGQSVSFYGHDVVLPAFGWHVSWVLRHWWDRNYALILVGGLLAIAIIVILVTGIARVRVFTVTALVFGFLFAVFAATVTWWVTINGVKPDTEPGARYTCLPILLITAILIVAVDNGFMSKARRPVSALAAIGLIALLCIGWIPDFRYLTARATAPQWAPKLATWLDICQHADAVHYFVGYEINKTFIIPCSRIHELSGESMLDKRIRRLSNWSGMLAS
jgi:hypothetical protein